MPDIKSTVNIQGNDTVCPIVIVIPVMVICTYVGREFQAVLLSTTEPTHTDGSTRNPTRSLCDPYVFNTALTRAKSLVIAVGNPFLLLNMEKQMIKRYSSKKGHCWSTFLKTCIDNSTLKFAVSKYSVEEQGEYTRQLCQRIQEVNPDPQESKEQVKLKRQIAELEASIVHMQPITSPTLQPVSSSEMSPSHIGPQVSQQSPVTLPQSQNSYSFYQPLTVEHRPLSIGTLSLLHSQSLRSK